MGPIICPVYSGALFSGHQRVRSLCPVYSGALFSGHQWDLSFVRYTVEPSLVDTNGTYHCVQYTVKPSLVDTNGTCHCVQYSEVSLSQGLLYLRVDCAVGFLPTTTITLPYSIGSGQFEMSLVFESRCCSNSGGLMSVRPLTAIE